MTPRSLVTAIATVFAGCVLACIATWIALRYDQFVEMEWSHRVTRLAVCMVFAGLAVRMGVRLVRGCVVERWFTVLACLALAAGIFVNSNGHPAPGMVILGAAFGLCAIGLLTPFVGRHFAAKPLAEDHSP